MNTPLKYIDPTGCQTASAPCGYGGYQTIEWDAKNKVYYGASESRKDGEASGY